MEASRSTCRICCGLNSVAAIMPEGMRSGKQHTIGGIAGFSAKRNECQSVFQFGGFILRDAAYAAPPATTAKPLRRDEVLDPHGEERGNAARLEP
jgi:hypothetical protein